MEWIELSRSLSDVPRHPVLVLENGVELTSLETWGDTLGHRRSIYELNKTCSADIPDRGTFFGFEEHQSLRFDAEVARPDGMVLAFNPHDSHHLTGLCQVTCPPDRERAFIEMTCVLAAYRRRGIANSMKRQALAVAAGWGCSTVRTLHHAQHAATVANRALGLTEGQTSA